MLTARRLYIYGVLAVSLVLLLWGLNDLLRAALGEISRVLGTAPAYGGSLAREELSRAVALVLVAGGIYGVHLALVRRSLRGSPEEVTDERAATPRAAYFFLVVLGTGAAFLFAAFQAGYQLITSLAFAAPDADPLEALASVAVFGGAWAIHVHARHADLLAAPERLAGDWLTRAYLYGTMLLTLVLASTMAGDAITTIAREVLGLQPLWGDSRWWQESIPGPLAAATVAAIAWLIHWSMARHLLGAGDPIGVAHRTSRTRRGYLLAVVAVGATAVLLLASTSLHHLLAALLGTSSSTAKQLLEDIGGPLLMLVPFVPAWWWHQRALSREAIAIGGPREGRTVARLSHLAVALVGLAGLAAGVAWALAVVIDAVAASGRESLVTTGALFGAAGTEASALALVGLALWTPAWAMAQRDRTIRAAEAAAATSRRAYLMLVCGIAVVAAMGALAYLVWQGVRVLLESGRFEDPSWAISACAVAAVTLGYHAWQLRADLHVAPPAGLPSPLAVGVAVSRPTEVIEISGPSGSDFRVLNAAIRSELPEGYELRIVSHRP